MIGSRAARMVKWCLSSNTPSNITISSNSGSSYTQNTDTNVEAEVNLNSIQTKKIRHTLTKLQPCVFISEDKEESSD